MSAPTSRSGEQLGETMLVWNGSVARLPALVVRPRTVEEVAAAVEFARDHGLLLSIGDGIPSTAGESTDERTVTLDLSQLRKESRNALETESSRQRP